MTGGKEVEDDEDTDEPDQVATQHESTSEVHAVVAVRLLESASIVTLASQRVMRPFYSSAPRATLTSSAMWWIGTSQLRFRTEDLGLQVGLFHSRRHQREMLMQTGKIDDF